MCADGASQSNVTFCLKRVINNNNLALTLLLPRGKWWLQALRLISYQTGSHVTSDARKCCGLLISTVTVKCIKKPFVS